MPEETSSLTRFEATRSSNEPGLKTLGNIIHGDRTSGVAKDEGQGKAGQESIYNSRDREVQNGVSGGTSRVKCKKCSKWFVSQECVNHHVRKVHDRRPECKICFKKFDSFGCQVKSVHGDGDSKASNGDKMTIRGNNNKNNHDTGSSFKCDSCHKTFAMKESLYGHIIKSHLKALAHKCDKCPRLFVRKKQLMRHNETVHLDLKEFQCEQCKKYFSYKSSLFTHVQTFH